MAISPNWRTALARPLGRPIRRAHYLDRERFTNVFESVTTVIAYANSTTGSDSNAGKDFFANDTTDGKKPVSDEAMATFKDVGGAPDPFGRAYGRPAKLPAPTLSEMPVHFRLSRRSCRSWGWNIVQSLDARAGRRPITVMFCDLVGSTGLAARLDAEDSRNLVVSYLDEASAAVTGLAGHVLKKLGDGLMALFGYPQAQENDAERAVRAALAIQRALADLNARNAWRHAPQLIARIGLESGQLVVDATGEVFGEAPNIATRVQGAAEPGAILVTATVQRQTAGLFVAEDLGARELKGVSELVTLYRIVRASGGGRRGGARALTPLVGREEELDLLSRRWERARKGEDQFALVVGEPGLGKSRLIGEFRARLGETPRTWVERSSSQLLQNTPLHPIAEWGRQRFGADMPAERRLADLENTLQLVGLDTAEYAPLVVPLVEVPLPEDRAAIFAPKELRRRQLVAMTAWVLAGARTQPAVIAFEDSDCSCRRKSRPIFRVAFSCTRALGRLERGTHPCRRSQPTSHRGIAAKRRQRHRRRKCARTAGPPRG
jgi:class 3 adenylate cyclase